MTTTYRKLLAAKIHRARVTHADLEYEGSITLSPELLEAANLSEYEAVQVWNVTNGARFETYTICGDPGSTDICINGAAAHHASPGDTIIIACFQMIPEQDVAKHCPRLVFVNENNEISHIGPEVPGPKLRVATH